MYRLLLVAVAFTLVFGATAAARTRVQAARPRTLAKVRGGVDALAQNGRRIAWIKTQASCGKQVQILTLPGRQPVDVGSRRGWSCPTPEGFAASTRHTLGAIALGADGRVLWQVLTGVGNTEFDIDLVAAALRAPQTRLVASLQIGYDAGDPDDSFSHALLGSAPLRLPTAADGNTVLFYALCDLLCRREGIYRLVGRRSRPLSKITNPTGLAVSGRRFAVVTNSLRCCNSKPAWSHDGMRLAWVYHGNLWTVRADGTDDRQLAAGVSPSDWSPDDLRRPSWSPDGGQLAFEHTVVHDRRGVVYGSGVVYRVNATGGGLRRLAVGTAPAWSPDGTRIAFVRGKGVFAIKPDGTGATKLTATARVTAGPLSWSPDSTRIAVSRGGGIYSVRADGAGETRLTTSRRREAQPAWSADGARIAYVAGSGIAIVNADGTGATRLTSPRDIADTSPAWSPDSKRVAFVRKDTGGGDLWVVNADGSGRRRLIPAGRSTDSPQWAPSGSMIVVGDWYDPDTGNLPSRPGGIRLVSPVNGKAKKIAPVLHSPVEIRDALTGRLIKRFTIVGHAHSVALGPDYVALLVDHEPGVRVELYNLNGSFRKAAAVPANVRNVSAAGRTVVFATGRFIRRLDARTGAVTALARAHRTPVGLAIEGRRIVWAENGRGAARIRAVTAP